MLMMAVNNSGGLAENVALTMTELSESLARLSSPQTRERALLELCKMRESITDFAPMLWHAFGAVPALLQEITAIYPYLDPPNLSAHQSNRVCNALALLQCLASHPQTRADFLKAHIPLYLYCFLNIQNDGRPFEYLRLTSLGVIGALAKTDEPDAITFLLNSEIIPLCLNIMQTGSELSKTVATFIMQKLLQDPGGLDYICQTFDRFSHVATVLGKMVNELAVEKSNRLLKHVVRCYQRLCDDSRAREALRNCLPPALRDNTFAEQLEADQVTQRCLSMILNQLSLSSVEGSGATAAEGAADCAAGLASNAGDAAGTDQPPRGARGEVQDTKALPSAPNPDSANGGGRTNK